MQVKTILWLSFFLLSLCSMASAQGSATNTLPVSDQSDTTRNNKVDIINADFFKILIRTWCSIT